MKHRKVMKWPFLPQPVNLWISRCICLQRFLTATTKQPSDCQGFLSDSRLHSSVFSGEKSNCSINVTRQSNPQKVTWIKLLNQWLSWWEYHIVHGWTSVYWFRILRVNYALGSAASTAPPPGALPPTFMACSLLDWNSNHKPTELWIRRKMPPFHPGGNTQIFCVFRTTILFLCLIKLHSGHSIIKTRQEFMNKWSIYYIGQRKDKLYAWKVSLSCDSHKPMCWQGWGFFFLSPQQLNQSCKICI